MNAAVNHIMQNVDWTRFSLEEWLYQFGAWMHSNSGPCGKSINPIAVAMDQVDGRLQILCIGTFEQHSYQSVKPEGRRSQILSLWQQRQ